MGHNQRVSTAMEVNTAPKPWLAWLYLALAIAGGVLPWMANVAYMREYGSSFDLGRHLWLVLLSSVTIAFAFAAPFFLFLRERRLAELARQAAGTGGSAIA
jgi:hypothetical protein